ncbi:carbohydrate ABC transporter permease [Actinocatenispora sera]|uniref:Sugar ABC transporter permease n=1 Tax=Actinocatenispora sera TaxID=390989 RepID=A0A810KZS3_9ACTN|nr:carbohydrate ABC transporter permease [Actinocatenispora sera]BCJ28155.1 sugar ABC transporter permease [Actinocatenispora sera]
MSTVERVARKPRRNRRRLWAHLPLAIVAVATIFPFYVMIVLSLRKGQSLSLPDALLPFHVNFGAYADVLAHAQVVRWMLNTAAYSVLSVVLVLVFASFAAYAFAKKRFFGRNAMFWTLLATLMVPYHLTLIPQFILISRMDGLDTLWGLIVPTLANTQALFLMRQFIMGIPDELIEAARIDGAGEIRLFWQIVLPQTKPILATLGVFVFLWHWNDFLWPLVATRSPDHYVLTVGLNSLQAQDSSLTVTMAGAVLTFLPILLVYVLLQRYFVRGVTMSGLK